MPNKSTPQLRKGDVENNLIIPPSYRYVKHLPDVFLNTINLYTQDHTFCRAFLFAPICCYLVILDLL